MTGFGLWLILLSMTVCQDKSTVHNELASRNKIENETKTDSLKKPKVDIKVNRHFDDKGNRIGFDSTYSTYYSTVEGDTARMDSLFGDFNRYFKQQHQPFFNRQFNDAFFTDSLLYPDFFRNDFFSQRYRLNDHYFKEMMSEMDSVKNKFYREHRNDRKTD